MTTLAHPVAYALPDIGFDASAIVRDYQTFLSRVPAYTGEGDDPGYGLTHRKGVADPWRDAALGQYDQVTGQKRYEEEEFSEFNEQCLDLVFHDIVKSMPFKVGRTRLITLNPVDIYHMHVDSTRKAHVAIVTNEHSRFLFGSGLTYHVPVDGRVYVFDTKTPHSAYNAGSGDRVHLVMSIID